MLSLLRSAVVAATWVVSVMFFSGCGGGSAGEDAVTASPIKELPRALIIVGDSIMAGCADSVDQPGADYTKTTAHLVAQQGVHVVNLSRAGNSMQHAVSQRVEGGINFTQGGKLGTAVWITLGANDFIWGFSTVEQYRERYRTVLSRIEQAPAQKTFCVTPLMAGFDYEHRTNAEGSTLEDYRQVVRDIAAAENCDLIDTSEWFDAADIYDQCTMPDTLHLGVDGHARYAKNLLQHIRGDY